MTTIPTKEYNELLECKRTDRELLFDIAAGIKDVLQGKVKEV